MAGSIGFYRDSVRNRITTTENGLSEITPGRGFSFVHLTRSALSEMKDELASIDVDVAAETVPEILQRHVVRYQRLLAQVDSLHAVVAIHGSGVGRHDLPVGFLHVLDDLTGTILHGRLIDPVICVRAARMYSTTDLTAELAELTQRADDEPGAARARLSSGMETTPIALNLPALDPTNVLLTPLLAHEVCHAALPLGPLTRLEAKLGGMLAKHKAAFLASLRDGSDRARADADWTELSRLWVEELICDGVATRIAGPSYLFALAVFLPPMDSRRAKNKHPPGWLRWNRAVATLGAEWLTFLEQVIPEVIAEIHDGAETPTSSENRLDSYSSN
jgi:hypothetical protein